MNQFCDGCQSIENHIDTARSSDTRGFMAERPVPFLVLREDHAVEDAINVLDVRAVMEGPGVERADLRADAGAPWCERVLVRMEPVPMKERLFRGPPDRIPRPIRVPARLTPQQTARPVRLVVETMRGRGYVGQTAQGFTFFFLPWSDLVQISDGCRRPHRDAVGVPEFHPEQIGSSVDDIEIDAIPHLPFMDRTQLVRMAE